MIKIIKMSEPETKQKIKKNSKPYDKEYYENNKIRFREVHRKYYEANKEKLKKYNRERYQNNTEYREGKLLRMKIYRDLLKKKNKEK
jgi:hypothetical protein